MIGNAIATGLLAVLFAQAALAQSVAPEDYRKLALELAGEDFRLTAQLQCGLAGAGPPNMNATTPVPPTRLADQFYYVGIEQVGAFALDTSDGIILIDALFNPEQAEEFIVPGLEAFGLDPDRLRYVIVTHEHGDHYGGAAWLHETYGATVVASEEAWRGMERIAEDVRGRGMEGIAKDVRGGIPSAGAPPQRGRAVGDEVLSLGDTEVRIYLTPGHTPGTISLIVPVTVDGAPHMVAMWGGTGLPRDKESLQTYVRSLDSFHEHAKAAGVDWELSNHPFVDDALARMKMLRENNDGPNPFVIGAEAYERYQGVLRACAMAALAAAK